MTSFLKPLYRDETITIALCDGSRCFKDPDVYEMFNMNQGVSIVSSRGLPTDATNISLFELVVDATCKSAFDSLGVDLHNLCFSEHQIINFCLHHRDKLCKEGYKTFFLYKVGDQIYIGRITFVNNKLVTVGIGTPLNTQRIQKGWARPRFIVPQISLAHSIN